MTQRKCRGPVLDLGFFSYMNVTHTVWGVADGRILRPYQQELK